MLMMRETDKITGYEEAVRNISGLYSLRMERGITQKELSQLLSISTSTLVEIEKMRSQPTIRTYNKIAKFFGWEKITKRTPLQPLKKSAWITDKDDTFTLKPVQLPGMVKFTFEEGHCYQISEKVYVSNNRGGKYLQSATVSWDKDYVFCYEGKQGIHHMFREVSGKWTRTYTDAQLIGKHIKEVDEHGNSKA